MNSTATMTNEDRVSTYDESFAEYARNVGDFPKNVERQWLLTEFDVWVRNPHYVGPEQRHPEDDSNAW